MIDYFSHLLRYMSWILARAAEGIRNNVKLKTLIENIQAMEAIRDAKLTVESFKILNSEPYIKYLHYFRLDVTSNKRYEEGIEHLCNNMTDVELDKYFTFFTCVYLLIRAAESVSFMKKAIQFDTSLMCVAPQSIDTNDPDLLIQALKRDLLLDDMANAWSYASRDLRSNKQFAIKVLPYIPFATSWYSKLSTQLKLDSDIILTTWKVSSRESYEDFVYDIFPSIIWENLHLVKRGIQYNPGLLKYIPPEHQTRDMVIHVIKKRPKMIKYVGKQFLNDPEIERIHDQSLIRLFKRLVCFPPPNEYLMRPDKIRWKHLSEKQKHNPDILIAMAAYDADIVTYPEVQNLIKSGQKQILLTALKKRWITVVGS